MPPVLRRVLLRLAIFAVSLVIASILIFVLCWILPGDLAQVILGANADPMAVEAMRRRLGLDQPLSERYWEWVTGMLRGDFGTSLLSRRSVSSQIISKLGVTAWLVGLGMLVAILIAVPVGMLAALRRRHLDGVILSALSQLGLAIPAFWAGIMAVYLFAVKLRWLPANGYVPLTQDPAGWAARLVLPVLSLALVQAAVLARYVRSATLEVLSEDYYRTARAIGWRQLPALLRHGLRNASLSVVTVLGLQLSTLLVGAIVIENVFSIPGLGSQLLTAASQRDLVLVQGTVMLLAFAVLLINTLVDLSYLLLDPRLRSNR
ncbi:ABC transporter permease [Enemella evansiae]|uniref:ABC transporter permease n=1 Tax=Enemella evansiae TaxID=2016499 RepID=A0A255GJB2_9ACTN|nr:ABC transporter permease [Enemella evansiae]PFG67576.1 peptide/nickel transport system permease protein [Propionibacteriaceae bacterium ES.041]OYN98916.1 ABC transporter permease [Enemella evansiae]OYO01230.1 ABC transporter permease [Enemella evansiae]OYO05058.1 ABC transporter permease [Enemella evansiae]OYO07519.1 ABC transporter permease [Enemella evansiae]